MGNEQNNKSDHDLLIELNTRVGDLIKTIERIDGGMAKDIGGLREGKVDVGVFATHTSTDRKEHEGFEKNIEKLFDKTDTQGRLLWIGIGILATLQFISPFVTKYFIK
jgi:hypothetical protein